MKRESWIDIAKGIGICLVVLVHAGAPGGRVISEFHMAMFFVISGYCFSDKYIQNIKSIVLLTEKRIKSLYFPFVIVNIFLVLTHNFFLKYHFYTDNPDFAETATGMIYGLASNYEDWQIKFFVKKILLFQSEQQLAGATWFLRTLFFLTITFAIINFILKILTKDNYLLQFIINTGISFVFLYIAAEKIQGGGGGHFPLFYENVFSAYFMFSVGYNLNHLKRAVTRNELIAGMAVSLFGLMLCDRVCLSERWISNVSNFHNPVMFIASSLAGTFLIFSISKLLGELQLGRVLSWIGKRTMSILLLHFICFKLITQLQVKIYEEPEYMLASFPYFINENGWWVFYTITGLVIPILLSVCMDRFKEVLTKIIKK